MPFDTVVLTVRGILRIKGSLLEAMKVEPGLSADQLASMARMFLTLPESLPLEIEYTELARTVLSEGHGS